MLEIKSYINEKYELKNDNEDIKYYMNKFVSMKYGNFLFVNENSIEKIDKINAYVDVYSPEIINNYYFFKKYSDVFFITANINNGRATITGPDRNNAIKLFNDKKNYEINNDENMLFDTVYNELSKIPEIKMALTPVIEIIRELNDKKILYLDITKTSDKKRLNYFKLVSDMDIFNYEIKYGVYIIKPGDKFFAIIKNDYNDLLSYIFKWKKFYFVNFSSVKPYIRTAYSYYHIAMLIKNNIMLNINDLANEYNNLYNKKTDIIKFKNYIDALVEYNILLNENGKIKGNENILKTIIKK